MIDVRPFRQPGAIGSAASKLSSACRFGVTANSVSALLRMRMFRSIVVAAGVPSTWATAVAIGPPLETISTSPPCVRRTWSSTCTTPAVNSAWLGKPCGCVLPAIQAARPWRSSLKCWRTSSGVSGRGSGPGWMARTMG